MSTATHLTPIELAEALRFGHAGWYAPLAAVELLDAHGKWLRDKDFRRFITYDEPGAIIHWDKVRAARKKNTLNGTDSELGALDIALDLVNGPLHDMLGSLDTHNTTVVLNAIAYHQGWHRDGKRALVDGLLGIPRDTYPTTFSERRRLMYAQLGDVLDTAQYELSDTEHITPTQRAAHRTARMLIAQAREALNDAV